MEAQTSQNVIDRRPTNTIKPRKWHKVWVPQDVVATGGKCFVMKWVTEATLKSLREKSNESVAAESKQKPEPTTEVLFLCSYEGCGKTFIDAGALRKHANIHGEKQHACHYPNCGKKFLDSSKLKRHFLIHTGAKDYVCPHEGCGKAFSLDFNLRSHMKTHSQENYHLCPYPGCGKRYAHEYKLKNHIVSYHEKNNLEETPKFTPPEKPPPRTPKSSAVANGSVSSDRPYACPYEGCEKAYIHVYKLNLHLKRAHPGHLPDKNAQASNDNETDAGSDQDAYPSQKGDAKKLSRPKANVKLEAAKVVQLKGRSSSKPVNNDIVGKKQWVAEAEVEEGGNEEEDSEETEEERDTLEGRWRYGEQNEDDDDEETEDED